MKLVCKSIKKKGKRSYYNNLDLKVFEDTIKSVKPLFSDKQKLLERNIVIMEDKSIFSDNAEVSEKLNNFFIEAAQNLEIEPFVSEAAISACEGDMEVIIKQ